jgi:hypothetical protein
VKAKQDRGGKKVNQKANKRENMRQTCGKNGNNNQIERAN